MLNQTRDQEGTLEPVGDSWRLRFTRRLAHAPDKVWRALTEPEHLKTWFPDEISGDWTVGGKLFFSSEWGNHEGEVLAFDPPRMVEFRWGPDILRLEVTPDGDGSAAHAARYARRAGQGRARRGRLARVPRQPRTVAGGPDVELATRRSLASRAPARMSKSLGPLRRRLVRPSAQPEPPARSDAADEFVELVERAAPQEVRDLGHGQATIWRCGSLNHEVP